MYEFYHYLPVDDSIIRWGIYVTGVGRGVIPPKDKYPPTGHPTLYSFSYGQGRVLPEFQIILITDGGGTFESKQTGQISIEPNTLIFLFPDVWHRYKPDDQAGWKERWISISGPIAHHLMEDAPAGPKNAVLQLSESEHLISSFDRFLDKIHSSPSENTIRTSIIATALLCQIIELFESEVKPEKKRFKVVVKQSHDALVDSVLDIIWTQSHRPIFVDSILIQIPASRRTLERRFQKTRGHSIHEEIMQCRVSRAKRLLQETRLPIKTVAYLSGFSSSERMRRSFIKLFAQPPSKFRK